MSRIATCPCHVSYPYGLVLLYFIVALLRLPCSLFEAQQITRQAILGALEHRKYWWWRILDDRHVNGFHHQLHQ